LTIGVEEEFLLVGGDGQLAAAGPEVSATVDDAMTDGDGQVEHELRRCQVESATPVCATAVDVRGKLRELRDRLAAEAARHGLRLLPSATAPLRDERPARFTPNDRYHRVVHEFGALAPASLTCATHVHIAIPDRPAGLRISNHIRPWLPVLLALTGNSPLHEGIDTGYASWRHQLWSRWPSAGPPPHQRGVDDYDRDVAGLLAAGAALDRAMVFWDIRLSERHPTVEIRIADVLPTVDEAATLAALVRGLAAQALHDRPADGSAPSQSVLRASLWRSARDGMAGHCVDPRTGTLVSAWQAVDGLVDGVRPWLRASGDEVLVAETLASLRTGGDGAQRQRAAAARRHQLTDVVDDLVWPGPAGG
jgi:carboxylate-amine ligase